MTSKYVISNNYKKYVCLTMLRIVHMETGLRHPKEYIYNNKILFSLCINYKTFWLSLFSLFITQYNAYTYNARTLTPINARTQTIPL